MGSKMLVEIILEIEAILGEAFIVSEVGGWKSV